MKDLLVLEDISKSYGRHVALDHISFSIHEKKIFGLLGPNGAGKTTLIRIITNIMGADTGKIVFNGHPLHKNDIFQMGYLPEERGLYKKMKVEEQLLYLAQLKGLSLAEAKKRIDHWLDKFLIQDWKSKQIGELSKGMQQKIQFIATILHEPKLVILDEPFSGLDPINTNLIKKEIRELKEKGTTIIFSTHRMEQVEAICEYIVLVNKGNEVLEGKVADVKNRFKKNEFSIKYIGKAPALPEDKFIILEKKEGELIIHLEDNLHSPDIMKILADQDIQVTGFEEILPSLNEIFIEQVTKVNI